MSNDTELEKYKLECSKLIENFVAFYNRNVTFVEFPHSRIAYTHNKKLIREMIKNLTMMKRNAKLVLTEGQTNFRIDKKAKRQLRDNLRRRKRSR